MNRAAWVMVNHNGGEEVLLSARSVLEDLGEDDRLVLVDNGSSDNSGVRVRDELAQVKYISHEENRSFAEANNRGIRWALEADYSFIGLINPDVRVRKGMTDYLVRRIAEENGAHGTAAGPVILYENPPDTIWYAGGRIHWLVAWMSHRGNGKPVTCRERFRGPTDYLTGCCWLAEESIWRRVGPLDDRYGMYAEDVDWSVRARRKGVKLVIEPEALLVHRLSHSSGGGRTPFKMTYRTLASRLFFRYHTPAGLRFLQHFLAWIPASLYAALLLYHREYAALRAFIRASFQPLGERVPWPPKKQATGVS